MNKKTLFFCAHPDPSASSGVNTRLAAEALAKAA